MTDIDNLREQTYASQDPQFQDPDAYDKDEWLDILDQVSDHINDAILTLQQADEMHALRNPDRIIRILKEADSRLGDER